MVSVILETGKIIVILIKKKTVFLNIIQEIIGYKKFLLIKKAVSLRCFMNSMYKTSRGQCWDGLQSSGKGVWDLML